VQELVQVFPENLFLAIPGQLQQRFVAESCSAYSINAAKPFNDGIQDELQLSGQRSV
jgi:hypothetical protein